jgi:hypothetical protein
MKYAHLWERRVLRRGTFWTFNGTWLVRVKHDLSSVNRPYAVLHHDRAVASYQRLAEAKTEVLRRLVKLQEAP